jgi:hypothetical protein
VDGGKEDLIRLPSGRLRSSVSVRPHLDLNYVKEYQVVQEREDLIIFRYAPAKLPMTDEMLAHITDGIRQGCMGEDVTIESEEVQKLDRGPLGKLKCVVSKVKKDKEF